MKSLYISALLCSFAFVNHVKAQDSPGGIHGSTTWYSAQNADETIGNHKAFNLLDFQSDVDVDNLELEGSSTLYFVLNPNFEAISGTPFMRLGDIVIYDDHIQYANETVLLTYEENEPLILSLQMQRSKRYAHREYNDVEVYDSRLFSIAELIVFPGIHSREELRKVNSYLALKYSITITENDEERWRDYWMADNGHYWDTRIDRLYKERVIGIGRSDDERFLQTQTVTTKGEVVQIALEEFAPIGQNPEVQIAEDAFMIFSEKASPAESAFPCFQSSSSKNPLHLWKFKLQNWSSTAEWLKIRVDHTPNKSEDSLFLSDGRILQYLSPQIIDSNIVEYAVNLTELQSQRHYFFTNRSGADCDNVDITAEESDVVVFSDDLSDHAWVLETQSLLDGSLVSTVESGNTATRSLEEGQYVVSVLDPNGNLFSSSVVWIENSNSNLDQADLSQFEMKVYPNPAGRNQESILSIRNLPSTESIRLVVSDAAGKIHLSDSEDYSQHIERTISLSTPGMYTVTVYQEESIYSVKLIILSE